jgi:hypothetical protein
MSNDTALTLTVAPAREPRRRLRIEQTDGVTYLIEETRRGCDFRPVGRERLTGFELEIAASTPQEVTKP